MDYKRILREYVDSDSTADMEMLACLTDDFVHKVEEAHPDLVETFLRKLKVYIHPLRDRKCAEYVVSMFKNKDGSTGAHWDYDTTTKVLEAKGYDYEPCAWYWALNMIYSDYYTKEFSDSVYIELAKDFLDDPDSPTGLEKSERYIKAMMY